jgi:hypothetical protein
MRLREDLLEALEALAALGSYTQEREYPLFVLAPQ